MFHSPEFAEAFFNEIVTGFFVGKTPISSVAEDDVIKDFDADRIACSVQLSSEMLIYRIRDCLTTRMVMSYDDPGRSE